MNVISIDFSKKCTAMFRKLGPSEDVFEIKNKSKDKQNKVLQNIFKWVMYSLENMKHDYDFGLIEGYRYNFKKTNSITCMAEICGVIKLAFALNDIALITVPIQVWKSQTIGTKYNKNNGNYLNDIHSLYGKKFNSIDAADAYLIYLAVKKISNAKKNITPAMQKIRDRLKEIFGENICMK